MADTAQPLRATLLVLLSAGALAGAVLTGLALEHPFVGALAGYLAFLAIAVRAFESAVPGADEVMRGEELPPGLLHHPHR